MKFYITNFNPVPVADCLMDPTVGACLLAPELAGLLHAAKLYVIQQAVKETQPATDNSESTTASTSSVRAPVRPVSRRLNDFPAGL